MIAIDLFFFGRGSGALNDKVCISKALQFLNDLFLLSTRLSHMNNININTSLQSLYRFLNINDFSVILQGPQGQENLHVNQWISFRYNVIVLNDCEYSLDVSNVEVCDHPTQ